jgi:hypothetical protein
MAHRGSDPSNVAAFVFLLLFALLGAVLLVAVVGSSARAAYLPDSACVSVSEARSVTAGETVQHMLARLAPDHSQLRVDRPQVRDTDLCRGKAYAFRFKYAVTSGGHQVVSWRALDCRVPDSCTPIAAYPRSTR